MDQKTINDIINTNSDPNINISTTVQTEPVDQSGAGSESESEPTNLSESESTDQSESEPTNQPDQSDLVNPKPKYLNLVLSGGSTRGIAHIGAIAKLIEADLLDLTKLKGLASTSAGSMLGVLIVLGFTIDEIWSFIRSIDFKKLISPNIFLFPIKCGIESGRIIYNLVEEILTRKTGISNITFEQLHQITNIAYTVVGSCLTTKEAVYYNHINTPNFKVSLAVRISMSMPGFFTPVIIEEKTYLDGALIDNYPIELFHEEIDQTIGIIICNDYDTDYKYPEEYCGSIMNLFMWICYKKDETKYKENTIYIKKNIGSMSMLDFNLSICKKNRIYQSGVLATEEFIAGLELNRKNSI